MMHVGNDKHLDQAIYVWFKQKRMEGAPVTGPMLCEKAVQFSKRIHGEDSTFRWQYRVAMEVLHGIRNLSLQGEKLLADKEAAASFIASFRTFVEEELF